MRNNIILKMITAEKNILKRGLLIAFEGLDRSGKSSLTLRAVSYIQDKYGSPSKKISFPSMFICKNNLPIR
jgi:hypothetical protein